MQHGQEPYIDGDVWVYPNGRSLPRVRGGEETDEEKAEREKREREEQEERDRKEREDKPPWGDEEKNFDADRAWTLIQKLRKDLAAAKSERDELKTWKQEREDADKTDEEKREERATKAEKEAAEERLNAARLKVALKKGLNETQARRLVGESEEDLEKDADELLDSFKDEDEDDDRQERRRPTENLRRRSGAVPDAEPDEMNPDKLAAQVPRMND